MIDMSMQQHRHAEYCHLWMLYKSSVITFAKITIAFHELRHCKAYIGGGNWVESNCDDVEISDNALCVDRTLKKSRGV